MNIVIETYDALPCRCRVFKINGINACSSDFVTVYDADPDNAPDYGCGNMTAKRLDIYTVRHNLSRNDHTFEDLSDDEIYYIQNRLCDALDVGTCGWCI